jgi:hypothetical protein
LEQGAFVAFSGGKLVGTGMDKEKMFKDLDAQGIHGSFLRQDGVPDEVIHFRSPHNVR